MRGTALTVPVVLLNRLESVEECAGCSSAHGSAKPLMLAVEAVALISIQSFGAAPSDVMVVVWVVGVAGVCVTASVHTFCTANEVVVPRMSM